MAARCVTALLGGYLLAAASASLLARILPVERVEATIWGMIASFLLYACVALWAFHEARLVRVATVIWGGALLATAVTVMMGHRA